MMIFCYFENRASIKSDVLSILSLEYVDYSVDYRDKLTRINSK